MDHPNHRTNEPIGDRVPQRRVPKTYVLYNDIEKRKSFGGKEIAERFAGLDRNKIDSSKQESHEKAGSALDREDQEDYSVYRCDEEEGNSMKEWDDMDNFWNQEGAFEDEVSRVQDAATYSSFDYCDDLEIEHPPLKNEDWGDQYPESEQIQEEYALEAYADDHYNEFDFFFKDGDRCSHSGFVATEGDISTLFFTDMFDPYVFCEDLVTESAYQQCVEDSGFMLKDRDSESEALGRCSHELELRTQQRNRS